MAAPDGWLRLLEELLEAEHRQARALQRLADARRELAADGNGSPAAVRRVRIAEAAVDRAGSYVRRVRNALDEYGGGRGGGGESAGGHGGSSNPGTGPDGQKSADDR